MDLQRGVGIDPGGARGEQLGHPGLDVAPAAEILGAGGGISQLAGHDDIDMHHRELVRNARKFDDRATELLAIAGVSEPQLERPPRHPDGAGGGLDTRALERLHQLLEPGALTPAQQGVGGRGEAIELERVFAHPAIAQHLDLAAGQASVGERLGFAPALLGHQQQRQSGIAHVGGRSRHQRHKIGARGVRDPGFGAVDPPPIGGSGRASREAGHVGAGIGFGEYRSGQYLAAGDSREPVRLLFERAAKHDQFARNFRAGAERAGADPTARQFLGDDAHHQLAQPQPAEFLGNAHPEGAHIGHRPDQIVGNQRVGQVPAVGMGDDPLVGKAAVLIADRIEHPVAQRFGHRRPLAQQRHQPRAVLHGVPVGDQGARVGVCRKLVGAVLQTQRRGPDDLVLSHRQTADHLRQRLAESDRHDQPVDLGWRFEMLVPPGQCFQRRGGGRDPGIAVRRVLFSIEARSG